MSLETIARGGPHARYRATAAKSTATRRASLAAIVASRSAAADRCQRGYQYTRRSRPLPRDAQTQRRDRRSDATDATMIIVNAEAVEATAATLSAAEALEILAPAGPALTNEEAASLRQIVAAVATRDPATAQRLAAKPPPPPPPPQNGSAASNSKLSSRPPTSGYADGLVARAALRLLD